MLKIGDRVEIIGVQSTPDDMLGWMGIVINIVGTNKVIIKTNKKHSTCTQTPWMYTEDVKKIRKKKKEVLRLI